MRVFINGGGRADLMSFAADHDAMRPDMVIASA